ncbi:MAG: YtxH domain-containing protein [bacterium]
MRDEGYGSSSMFLAFLMGGLVGAGFALLLAPKSGRELRKQISDLAEEAKQKASEYVEHTKERVSSTIEKGKELYGEQKSAVTTAIEAGKEAYHREKERHIKA